MRAALDPRRLLVLEAVVRHGSMTLAAEHLDYSPAAVSQQIAALESQAGTALLERLPRGVRPTAAGRIAVVHAAAISAHLAATHREMAALARGDEGQLRVASFAAASAGLLPVSLAALAVTRPDVRLSVEHRDAAAAVAGVRNAEVDVALITDFDPDVAFDLSELDAQVLGFDVVLAMLPTGHPLARDAVVALDDLVDAPWIQTRDALCVATAARSDTDGDRVPKIATHTDDHAATRALVAAGLGMTLIPGLLAAHGDDLVAIRPVDPTPRHHVLVVTSPRSASQPAVQALRRAVVDAGRAKLLPEPVQAPDDSGDSGSPSPVGSLGAESATRDVAFVAGIPA